MENNIKRSRKCMDNDLLYENSENENNDSVDENPLSIIESNKEKSNGMYISLIFLTTLFLLYLLVIVLSIIYWILAI